MQPGQGRDLPAQRLLGGDRGKEEEEEEAEGRPSEKTEGKQTFC